MNVPSTAITLATDPVPGWCFVDAINLVNEGLAFVPSLSSAGGWTIYTRAVYNLAADYLICWEQDSLSAPIVDIGPPPLRYWAALRKQYGCLNFVPGVVSSTSDQGTSTSLEVPEEFKNFTIANLQNLKTPYGRAYLGIAQSWGALWGLS
jgi:hypothetical protein